MAKIKGTKRDDFIHLKNDGRVPPPGSNDIAKATDKADTIVAGRGDDTVFGGGGDDTARFNVSRHGADAVDLGAGSDIFNVGSDSPGQVRLTFTSAEVGNGNVNDSNTLANQDGGLAVRLQAENGSDKLKGPITRTDDEGITFVADKGVTFDVRDLVSGAARGDRFEVVTLGTNASEQLTAEQGGRPYYINAGMGDDSVVGGRADDFLVGGAGNDDLRGKRGDDSFIGGGGDDLVTGGNGDDAAIHNITTDGADRVRLGAGDDVVTVNANAATEVRLTFTSAEVGNGAATDSGTLANQDGRLAVRMQAEDGSDGLTGPISRIDDEGITFVAGAGVKFDVRDLVSGTARGDEFEVVTLGTSGNDELEALQAERPYYINGGMGDDSISGGKAADFLVGGAGNDVIEGGGGLDSFIGGLGADTFRFASKLGANNVDAVLDFAVADDTFSLDSKVFAGLDKGDLDADAFVVGTAATDDDHRIIYDDVSGSLLFDRDGSGDKFEAVAFAKVTAGLAINQDDFVIV